MARICHTRTVRRRNPNEIHRAAFDAVLEIERWERRERLLRAWRGFGEAVLVISGFVGVGLGFHAVLSWLVGAL